MDEGWCYEIVRRCRWRDGVTCVRCGSRRVTVHTRPRSGPRLKYLCVECRRVFNDLTGTVFAGSNLPLRKWMLGLSLMPLALSTGEYAKRVGVKWDTARRMSRRLLAASTAPGLVRDLLSALQSATAVVTGR